MDVSAMAIGAAMVTTGAALIKDLIGGKVRDVVTFVLVYAVAVAVTLVMRASDFGDGIDVGGKVLGSVNAATVLLVAFALMSLARVVYQATKAVDQSQSAAETKLPIDG